MLLFDANVFMTAANNYYAFDLAPSFWVWLERPEVRASAASVAAVHAEISAGEGDLVEWAHGVPADFWVVDDERSLAMVGELAAWAVGRRQYWSTAIDEFMDSADIRLIAAAVRGDEVVTNETPAPESQKRIKIPDVCAAFRVPYQPSFTAFRSLGLRL